MGGWASSAAPDELLGSSVEPLIVVVDDAHLLDDGVGRAPTSPGRDRRGRAGRHGEERQPPPDAVVALWKEGLAERVELLPLSQPESAELLSQLLDGRVASATVSRIWGWVRGNPLFLAEVVRAGQQAGALTIAEGRGAGRGRCPTTPVSPSSSPIVWSRWRRPSGWSSIYLAFGEPLSLEVLSHIAGRAAVEAAEDHGLVVMQGEGTVARLGHPLYGELLVRSTSVVRAGHLTVWPRRWRSTTRPVVNCSGSPVAARRGRDAQRSRPVRRRRPPGDGRIRLRARRAPGGGLGGGRRGDDAVVPARGRLLAGAGTRRPTPSCAECTPRADHGARRDHPVVRSLLGPRPVRRTPTRCSRMRWRVGRATRRARATDLVLEIRAHRASLLFFAGQAGESASEASAVLARRPGRVDRPPPGPGRGRARRAPRRATSTPRSPAPSGIVKRSRSSRPIRAIGDLTLGLCLAHCLTGDLATAESVASGVREVVLRDRRSEWKGAAVTLLGRVLLAQGRVRTAGELLTEAAGLLRQHEPARCSRGAWVCWPRRRRSAGGPRRAVRCSRRRTGSPTRRCGCTSAR